MYEKLAKHADSGDGGSLRPLHCGNKGCHTFSLGQTSECACCNEWSCQSCWVPDGKEEEVYCPDMPIGGAGQKSARVSRALSGRARAPSSPGGATQPVPP